jgi:hypothetical protein
MASEIATLGKIVKYPHRIYKCKNISPSVDYLSHVDLPRSAIAKVHRDAAIPDSTLRNWHEGRTQSGREKGFPSVMGIHWLESSTRTPKPL